MTTTSGTWSSRATAALVRVGAAGEGGGLVLVGHQQVDGVEEFGRQGLGGRRGEDRTDAVAAGGLARPRAPRPAGISSWRSRASAEAIEALVAGGEVVDGAVGAGDDDDRVAALVVHDDVRGAGRGLDGAQMVGVDAGVFEGGAESGAEGVVADRADHRDASAPARAAAIAWLAPLPPGIVRNSRPVTVSPRCGAFVDVGDEVHVRAAEHGDVGHGRGLSWDGRERGRRVSKPMPLKSPTEVARRFLSGAVQRSGSASGWPASRAAIAAGGRAVGVGVPAAGHGAADGAGEVAVRVGEGGGDQGGVGDGVDPVVVAA